MNYQLKKYPKYKPSGVEWIGEIPEEWGLKRLKYEVGYQKGKNPKELTFDEKGKAYLTMEYLRNSPKQIFFVEDYENYVSVFDNEILLLWDGSNAGEFIRSKEGILSSTMALLKIYNQDVNYAWHFFKVFENHLRAATIGMGVPHVNGEEFRNQYFILPPKPEQTAIANYLDDKTAKIDTLIEKKKKLIELYKEERTAVINQAVTKGLNYDSYDLPDYLDLKNHNNHKNQKNHSADRRKLKDSGIEWLGQIPEHWEVKKLKYLGYIRYGLGQPPRQLNTGLPLIRATNVERGKIIEKDLVFVDPEDVPFERDPVLKENDIIVVRSGAYTADSAIVPQKYEGAISGYDMVLRVYNDNPFFISYCLLSNYVLVNQLYLQRLRAAQPHLNKEELGETFLLLPDTNEQYNIVQQIETETKRIDEKIARAEKEIELLQEYRTALISEVVTGKIKVC